MSLGFGNFAGTVDFDDFAGHARNAVAHARRGGDQVEPEFALQPLLHDFHVQQAEESAAKSESQRHGIFRLVKKRGVVQLQFAERVTQRLVIVGEHGKKPRENHRLDRFKARQRRRRTVRLRQRVAHPRIGDVLDVRDDEANVAGFQVRRARSASE